MANNKLLKDIMGSLYAPQYENSVMDPLGPKRVPASEIDSIENDEFAHAKALPALPETDSKLTSDLVYEASQRAKRAPMAEEGSADALERELDAANAEQSELDAEPVIKDAITPAELLAQYRKLAKAQKNARDNKQALAIQGAASGMAQAIAMGHGAKIGDDSEALKAMAAQADQPVKDIQTLIKSGTDTIKAQDLAEMADPQSSVSQFYRTNAQAILEKLYPGKDFSKDLANASASQLQKVFGPALMKSMSPANKTTQQSQFIDKRNGDPLVFDPNTGKYMNALTRQDVPSGQVVRPVYYNNVTTGDREALAPGQAPVVVSSAKRADITPTQMDEKMKVSGFKPDKTQREALDKEKERVDNLTKNINEKVSAAQRILAALDSNSKQAMAVIKTQMPRLAGEVGNLNQAEQEAWTGSQALIDRASQWFSTKGDSELTESNKQEMRKILAPFLQVADTSRNSIMENSTNSLAEIHNIPPEFSRRAYSTVKPLGKREQEVLSGDFKSPDKNIVTVQGPSGQTVKMTKENAKKYLKKDGYTLVD